MRLIFRLTREGRAEDTSITLAALQPAKARLAARAEPFRWKSSIACWPNTSSIAFCNPNVSRKSSQLLHRRKERAERRTTLITELRKRPAEAEAKLKRLFDAIENGIADVSDPMLKERVTD